jgi:hypothetical protein
VTAFEGEGTQANVVVRALAAWGVDRAVGWTVAARVWTVLTGPISLVLIAVRLTPDEQGFYYTFASVVAFQLMFELGLGSVVLQFASHERAFLQWQPDGTLGGSAVEKSRLASLVRKTLRWYGVAAVLSAVALLAGGTLFFALKTSSVHGWSAPWIAQAVIASGTLVLIPLLSVLEGCGAIADVARVRLWQGAASNLAGWSVLLAGGRLWASPAISAAALLVGGGWVFLTRRRFFSDLLRTPGDGMSWREEVWPFQWRIAVSTISGYLILHLFIPVLFAWRGPSAAGRLGMTLAMVSAVFVVSTSLLTTKAPAFGHLIARRDFAALDAFFFPAMWRAFGAMAVGSAAIFGGTLLLRAFGHRWSGRILEPLPLALLLGAMLANSIVFAEAVYLRAHKREPFLPMYAASALLIATSTLLLGRAFGATGMMFGYCLATTVVSLGGGTWIFIRKRREWHS